MASKVPSTLLKRWELHDESPIMLKPPTSSTVEQVTDTEINQCSSWLEAFTARASHTASLSSTSLEPSYQFLQRVINIFRASVAQKKIKKAAPIIDEMIQILNSTVLEAQLMSHDAQSELESRYDGEQCLHLERRYL